MNWLTFAFVLYLFAQADAGKLIAANSELSPPDQAVASAEYRRKLISQYEASPSNFLDDSLLAVAVSFLMTSNYDSAGRVYDQFLESHPTNARAFRGRGNVCAMQSNYLGAATYYEKATKLGDVASLEPLVGCLLATGQSTEAERLVPQLRLHISEDDIAICVLALAVCNDPPDQELLLEAVEAKPLSELIRDEQSGANLARGVGRLYNLDPTNKTVLAVCRRIVDQYATNKDAWPKNSITAFAEAYMALGDLDAAEQLFREAAQASDTNSVALYGLGFISMSKHQTNEAIPLLRKAHALGDPRALPDLAAAYLGTSNFVAVRMLIPELLLQKGSDLKSLQALLLYALLQNPIDEKLFYQALEGYSDDQLLRDREVADAVLKGLKALGNEERFQRLLRLKQKQDAGVGG